MKRTPIIIISILVVGLVTMSFVSCDLAGATIDARIDSLLYDINYDRNNAYLNFSSSDTSDYNAIKDGTKLLPLFPTNGIPYTRDTLNTSNPDAVTTTLDDTGIIWGPKSASFMMIKEGFTWYIHEMSLDGSKIIQ